MDSSINQNYALSEYRPQLENLTVELMANISQLSSLHAYYRTLKPTDTMQFEQASSDLIALSQKVHSNEEKVADLAANCLSGPDSQIDENGQLGIT